MFSSVRENPPDPDLLEESHAQGTPEQEQNSVPTAQQAMGDMATQFLANNPDHELAEDTDAWPEDAPRALLAPWEERMAENGYFDQLSHLFAEGTVFDTDDFRHLRPNPKFKKEWVMVQQIYREANPSKARRAEVGPDDDSDNGQELASPRRKTKRAMSDSGDENVQKRASKRAKGGRRSKTQIKAEASNSEASVEEDGPTEGSPRRLAVYDTDDGNDPLSQFPMREPSTEPSETEDGTPGPRRRGVRSRTFSQAESEPSESEESTESEESDEMLVLPPARARKSKQAQYNDAEYVPGRAPKSIKRRQPPTNSPSTSEQSSEDSEETSKGKARMKSRVGNRPSRVTKDSDDDTSSSAGSSEEDKALSAQEFPESDGSVVENARGSWRARNRPIIPSTDGEDNSSANEAASDRTESDPSEDQAIANPVKRANRRPRLVVEDSEDSSAGGDENESTDTTTDAEDVDDILDVEDTAQAVDASNFVRRSGRARSHPQYY